jgi:hypothetical protein
MMSHVEAFHFCNALDSFWFANAASETVNRIGRIDNNSAIHQAFGDDFQVARSRIFRI